jgi:hypothetical protein
MNKLGSLLQSGAGRGVWHGECDVYTTFVVFYNINNETLFII